jgi:hypothetical protein
VSHRAPRPPGCPAHSPPNIEMEPISRGTGSSNPSPSSGESAANLTFAPRYATPGRVICGFGRRACHGLARSNRAPARISGAHHRTVGPCVRDCVEHPVCVPTAMETRLGHSSAQLLPLAAGADSVGIVVSNLRSTARRGARHRLSRGNTLPLGKVRHDVRGEKFPSLRVVPSIGIDQQIDAGILVSPDQVDGFGYRTGKICAMVRGRPVARALQPARLYRGSVARAGYGSFRWCRNRGPQRIVHAK